MRSNRNPLGLILSMCLLSFLGPSTLCGDVFLKQKRHTDAFQVMGKTEPAKDETVVMWISDERGRVDRGEDQSIIIRLDTQVTYFLDHTRMRYTELPFGTLDEIVTQSMAQSGLADDEQAKAQELVKNFMGMMKIEATVRETDERKVIRGWNCRKYLLQTKMMGMGGTSEIWATEDLKINYDLYRTMGAAFMARQPGAEKLFEEMEKIKGIPVLTVSTSGTAGVEVKSTEELVEASEKSPPAGLYDLPEGYRENK